ncbi:hypothetical protein HDV06_006203 [Boothiomyces sp. JEL0866]|nr:hypothetical protein HDV06_006203 [Boothiomyces sp. JEL0866]
MSELENGSNLIQDDIVNLSPKQKTLKSLILSSNALTVILFVGVYLICTFTEPFNRPFDTTDKSISHPHLPDIVQIYQVYIFVFILPLIVFSLTAQALKVVEYYLIYLVGMSMNIASNEFFKIVAGRLRPDFLDRCKPQGNACTGEASIVSDGRKSFYSGHSSGAFYVYTFVMLYMFHEGTQLLGLLIKRRISTSFCLFAAVILSFLPSYVAISRTEQYVHFPTDVLTGSLAGIGIATLVFFTMMK